MSRVVGLITTWRGSDATTMRVLAARFKEARKSVAVIVGERVRRWREEVTAALVASDARSTMFIVGR